MPVITDTITLGGKEFPVRKLSVRQLKIVVPRTVGLLAILGPAIMQFQQDKDAGKPVSFGSIVDMVNLTEQQIDDLSVAVQVTLQRYDPAITPQVFDDLECEIMELIGALPTVLKMTGLFKPDGDAKKEPAPGEAVPPQALTT